MYFKPIFIKTDVTSIKIYKNNTFVGIGATLHIFSNETSELVNKIDITETRGEHIFGIVPFLDNKLLLFCGNFILIFSSNKSYSSIKEIRRTTLPDWVLEAKLLDNETKIATVSMQNKLQLWDLDLNLNKTFECNERCILYSAHVCYEDLERVTVLSGTVFNEILIWRPSTDNINHSVVLKGLKKHEGVLFSLQYSVQNGYICSTSDDRSAILWKIESGDLFSELNKKNVNIFPLCQVYGHLSRVFRCLILSDGFVTAGEDSVINIWNLEGKLKRKVETNQGSPIWALDYDKNKELITTGGGNGGVYTFSLNISLKEEKICIPEKEKPKIIGILASNNNVAFTESGILYLKTIDWIKIQEFEDLRSYVVLQVSKCRKLVALAGFRGQLYIYNETDKTLQIICKYQAPTATRIISFHWLSCELFLTCQDEGLLTLFHLNNSIIKILATFILPNSSQRSTTSAVILDKNIVVGDRKGHLHMYKIGNTAPIQTLPKVHSHLGVTNLTIVNNNLISLGRNSTIKIFSKNKDELALISSDKVAYSWLLDIKDNLLIAFSGENFIIFNHISKRVLLEKPCGGGHRSWDFFKHENTVDFIYIKDKFINKVEYDLNKNKSYDLVDSYHLKEVNCMHIIKTSDQYILISGGEDTTLRITATNLNNFKNLVTLKSHLSSIRCITAYKIDAETYLIISAGGRAQIVCWTLEYCLNSPLENIICRENHSYYEIIDSEESETRIMDLCVAEIREQIILFAACSDGLIKIFFVEKNDVYRLKFYKNVFYKLKCVFKVFSLRVFDKNVLVTLASDGCIVFWDTEDLFFDQNVKPFGTVPVHQSGINAFSKLQINSTSFLILTAGDDNTVALNFFNFNKNDKTLSVHLIDTFFDKSVHWAQITGAFIIDNYFLTASVDQRIILYEWKIVNDKLVCESVVKYNSPIADIKGLWCFAETGFDVFVYGIGVEFLKLVNK